MQKISKRLLSTERRKGVRDLGQEFIVNKDAEKLLLLIPVYKESDKIFAEEKEPQKYGISKEDFHLASAMFNYLGKKISLVKYECDVKVIEKAGVSFQDREKDKYFDNTESRSIGEPDLLVDRILGYFSVRDREFDKFEKLENEIIHFKRIKFRDGNKFDAIIDSD